MTKDNETVYFKLQKARNELQKLNLKKSGKNNYSGFSYFELKDFIPSVNEIFLKFGLSSNFSISDSVANLFIVNCENPQENILFTSPIERAPLKGCTPIQEIGAVHTYMKRYLYLNALEIVEDDVLDQQAGKDTKPAQKNNSKVSEFAKKLKEKLSKEQISAFCTKYNIKSSNEATIDEFYKNYDLDICISDFLNESKGE